MVTLFSGEVVKKCFVARKLHNLAEAWEAQQLCEKMMGGVDSVCVNLTSWCLEGLLREWYLTSPLHIVGSYGATPQRFEQHILAEGNKENKRNQTIRPYDRRMKQWSFTNVRGEYFDMCQP